MVRFFLAILFVAGATLAQEAQPLSGSTNGVQAVFRQGNKTGSIVLPNLALFVGDKDAPALFLTSAPFTAELRGFISVNLRAAYSFRARVSGDVELSINGTSVLSAQGNGQLSDPSKPIRLNRGKNALLVRFKSPGSGEARLQCFWASKNWPLAIPVPTEALSYEFDPESINANELRRGLEVLSEFRCFRCHTAGPNAAAEWHTEAPDFAGIGARLNVRWMADWIANPVFGGAHMPRLFSGTDQTSNSRAIAAFLVTLTNAPEAAVNAGDVAPGAELFNQLHCRACHAEGDAALAQVRRKFKPGALSAYLQNPPAHYRWNPMPDFKLSRPEADNLAAYLDSRALPASDLSFSAKIEQGRELVQNSGCLNCHGAPLKNQYSAPTLALISSAGFKGCLSTNDSAHAPRFNLKPEQREAAAAFLRNNDFSPVTNSIPHELALREMGRLRCAACHEKVEGLPQISVLGAKLKPEWMSQFIAGDVADKPRPWMAARMPAFPAEASALAFGLAALQGNPPKTAGERPVRLQLAASGAKLVSAAGGFACVACHAVGSFTSGQVVETPGVNLADASERLLPDYFQRWVMNPVAIDATTKMPVYFDAQGRSQLTEILGGEGNRQIEAIWEYVRLGRQMPPPPTP